MKKNQAMTTFSSTDAESSTLTPEYADGKQLMLAGAACFTRRQYQSFSSQHCLLTHFRDKRANQGKINAKSGSSKSY